MNGPKDEINFIYKDKNNKIAKQVVIENFTSEQVSYLLTDIYNTTYDNIYTNIGVDIKKIDEKIDEITEGKNSITDFLANVKANKIKKEVIGFCNTPAHYKLAQSYVYKKIFDKFGFRVMITKERLEKTYSNLEKLKISGKVREDNEIIFIAKYKDWIVIKKLLIDAKLTKDEEVSLNLASINKSITEKIFELLGVDVEKIDEIVNEKCAKLKKGQELFVQVISTNLEKDIKGSYSDSKAADFTLTYYRYLLAQKLGVGIAFDLNIMKKVYPELKIPKPRGNYGKKKKKK